MNRDELLTELRSLNVPNGDIEIQHGFADKALIQYINDPEIAEAYEAIEKWYA